MKESQHIKVCERTERKEERVNFEMSGPEKLG